MASRNSINDSADRLSNLPDPLLCHILSFIDTKYAVATSILSKRWKHLYIYVPNIILDDSLTRNIRNEESFTVFAMFSLKQIMHRTVPHINLLRLKCNFIFKYHLIKTLLSAAIFRNVKELDICISMANGGNVLLPPELFTSMSLVVLKLKGVLKLTEDYESSEEYEPVPSVVLAVVLVVPDLVSLPSLKVLHLGSFVLNSSVNRLFWGCKSLEDLCLSRCIYEVDDLVIFPFPFLRKLSIKGSGTWDHIDRIGIAIDAPNLELFEYHAEVAKYLWMNKPMSNGVAKFDFWETKLEVLLQFITELRGFKSLYLLECAPEDFFGDYSCDAPFKAPAFETLTRLEFCSSFIGILPNILDCAPQLEVLVVHKLCAHEEITVKGFERETVPTCLTEHLRNIEFRLYITHKFKLEQDFEVMKYFLQNGKVLKRMKISIECWFYEFYDQRRSTPSSIRKSVLEKLKMLQGFSETCEVFIEY